MMTLGQRQQSAVNEEINRLSVTIALLRLDLEEELLKGTPKVFLHNLCSELAHILVIRSLLETGRYNELPFPIRSLYLYI